MIFILIWIYFFLRLLHFIHLTAETLNKCVNYVFIILFILTKVESTRLHQLLVTTVWKVHWLCELPLAAEEDNSSGQWKTFGSWFPLRRGRQENLSTWVEFSPALVCCGPGVMVTRCLQDRRIFFLSSVVSNQLLRDLWCVPILNITANCLQWRFLFYNLVCLNVSLETQVCAGVCVLDEHVYFVT